MTELTAEGRRERACSGLTSGLILTYVERQGGRAAVDAVLAATGMAARERELRDENAWFSFEVKMALWAAAADALGDPKVAEHAGAAVLELGIGTALRRALRALGSPGLVYRNVPRANAKFNWCHRMEAEDVGQERVLVRFIDCAGIGYHRYDCDYNAGLLRVVPELFGLPPAHVVHSRCGLRGADACEYEVSWTGGAQRLRRAGALAGLAAVAELGAAAIAAPALLPLAELTAFGGIVVVGVRAASYARGRLRSLERQVSDQELAATRMHSSLADLSSELRLDEVLDKITARASDAAGGKEFALLLDDGERIVADRHSGIPSASLRALETWAAGQRGAAQGEPLLVDDLAMVAALAPLRSDPGLPLGSLCAVPLHYRDQRLGMLVALAHGVTVFLPADVQALTAYAAQAAIAIDNARLVERLERQASEDSLTGLANQRAFHQAFAAAVARSEREQTPLAVVALDLDHFKAINDTHGHLYGDEVLRGVARALKSVVRPYDLVARLGGEEFALLLPGAGAESAYEAAERARGAIAGVPVDDRTLSASAGVAAVPGLGAPALRLRQLADRALYAAKAQGRGRTVCYVPRDAGGTPRTTGGERADIEALLEPGAIVPVFQPVMALATGQAVAYEALARFPSFPGRPVPEVFAAAHSLGLGARLEAAAIRAAIEVPGRPEGRGLSVNLSLSGLGSPELWEILPDELRGLVIEITEHEHLRSERELEYQLAQLRERGAHVALDDAGAGYAGLQQLLRVRPDSVKLDRSVVAGVAGDPARAALIASFGRFASEIGWLVCAEGVEDTADLLALAELDIGFAQGYLIGRPGEPWAPIAPGIGELVAAPLLDGVRMLGAASVGEPVDAEGHERLLAMVGVAAGAQRVEVWRAAGDAFVRVDGGEELERVPRSAAPAKARVMREGRAGQVLIIDHVGDPAERARLVELGFLRLLLLPVPGAVVACYASDASAWGVDAAARAAGPAARLAAALGPFPRLSVVSGL